MYTCVRVCVSTFGVTFRPLCVRRANNDNSLKPSPRPTDSWTVREVRFVENGHRSPNREIVRGR